MIENTSIYILNRIYFHKLTVSVVIRHREGRFKSFSKYFIFSFLFNDRNSKYLCVGASVCSPFVSMCGQVKVCGRTSRGNLVCVNLSAVEARHIFRGKSNFQPSISFFPPVHFSLFLHRLSILFYLTLKAANPPCLCVWCLLLSIASSLSFVLLFTVIIPLFLSSLLFYKLVFAVRPVTSLFFCCADAVEMNLCWLCVCLGVSDAAHSFIDIFGLKQKFFSHTVSSDAPYTPGSQTATVKSTPSYLLVFPFAVYPCMYRR